MPYEYIFNVEHRIVKRGTCIILRLIDDFAKHVSSCFIFSFNDKYNLFVSDIKSAFKYLNILKENRSILNAKLAMKI